MAPVLTRLSSGGGFGFSKITVASSAAAAVGVTTATRSLRFNSADSAYLSRTPASAGNRTVYTWSFWIKRSGLGEYHVFRVTSDASNYTEVYFSSNDKLNFQNVVSGSANTRLVTTQVFRDTSAWYHFVVAINGSTSAKIYVNGTEITAYDTTVGPGSSNHQVNNTVSHTLGSGASSSYANFMLANAHFIDGYAYDPSYFGQTNTTTGVWDPIVYTGSYGSQGWFLNLADNSAATAAALGKDTSGNGNNWTPNNFSVINNTQRWSRYFSVFGSGSSNVNGTELQAFDSSESTFNGYSGALLPSNYLLWSSPVTFTNATVRVRVNQGDLGTGTLEVNGASRTITNAQGIHWEDFGTLSTFNFIKLGLNSASNNGTYIYAVEVNGSLLVDSVFNYNNDSLVDSPTSPAGQTDSGAGGTVVGNYCTLNPLSSTAMTLSNGNLQSSTSTDNSGASGTFRVSTGKWYFEATCDTSAGSWVGWMDDSYAKDDNDWAYATGRSVYGSSGLNGNGGSYGATYTTNDVIGCALDLDNGTVAFYKNGVSQGTMWTGLTGSNYRPICARRGYTFNFGQRPFAYQTAGTNRPAATYKALCTANLPEGSVTTSGTFTGNASADGPFIYLNGVPTAMTINGNAVTFGTQADKLSNGFKLRTSSASYNTSGSNTYSITTTGDKFKNARAQTNP